MMRKIILLTLILHSAIADKFSWDFYKTFASTRQDKNFVISPVSLALVLGLTKEGASGQTKFQIQSGLSDLKFNDLSRRVNEESSLKSANKIFIRNGLTLKPTFQQIADKIYKSSAEVLDFSNPNQAASNINEWIEKSTQGYLKNVISPSSLKPDTLLLLLNAIFFKGSWVHAFEFNSEKQHKFFVTRDESFEINLMQTGEKELNYTKSEELKFEAVELPYEGTNLRMVIILPKLNTPLSEVEGKLDDESLEKIFSVYDERDVNVVMPKIKIDSDFSCNQELEKLGMKRMLTSQADFDNLVEEKVQLKVSEVHQRAFIDINEHGTIAAAATTAHIEFHCSDCGPVDFIVNRPFLVMIKDNDFIYFMGRVVDPRN